MGRYEEICSAHKWRVPQRYNIAEDCCDKHPPDKLAMIHERFDGAQRELTWGDLQRLSNQAANFLEAHGVVRGDRVAVVLNAAISANDYLRSDQLLGRALGRILAHEVVHMLSSSAAHAHDGVAYKELTGRMLIAPVLRLQAQDFSRIRLKK